MFGRLVCRKNLLCAVLPLLTFTGLDAAPMHYTIQRLGFIGAGYTSSDGFQYSQTQFLNDQGQVVGRSTPYSGTTPLGTDTWSYNGSSTLRIGLTGAGYEASSGYRDTTAQRLNMQGQVAGYSNRYTSSGLIGQDAWLYNGSSTLQIGLTGAGYERGDGHRNSQTQFLNEQGQVAGYSSRYYSSTTAVGQDAWLYNGSSTVQIGLTGTGYERGDGLRSSQTQFLNDRGQVAGYSSRFSARAALGQDTWVYIGSSTLQIGLTGTGYEQSDGFRYSIAQRLNKQGQVVGQSSRFSGATPLGQDAWLYNGSSTLQIGLTGAGYERGDGNRMSQTLFLNEQGQVAGQSNRYSGTTALGQDAWLYNGSSTLQIGLTGVGYERSDGHRTNLAKALNGQGQVAGQSNRYSGTTALGQDAWLYNGSSTLQIGLTGAGYETSDGYRNSQARFLNGQGQVAGYSQRISTDYSDLGRDAWLYDGSSTLQIGLTGAGYEASNGFRYSEAWFLNGQGQVAGYSQRISTDSDDLGESAWLYDANMNQTFDLTLSIRPGDNYAFSRATYLGDDGLVLGAYTLFDQNSGADLGSRAFYFAIGDGLHDLGQLVDDLTPDGWLALATAISAGGMRNFIIGGGTLTDMTGDAAYLLTATSVPAPAAVWLLGTALTGLLVRRLRLSVV